MGLNGIILNFYFLNQQAAPFIQDKKIEELRCAKSFLETEKTKNYYAHDPA